MPDQCKIQEVRSSITYCRRFHTTEANLAGELKHQMPLLQKTVFSSGVTMAGYPFVCFHNMDLSNWDIEIAVPISAPLPVTADYTIGLFPGGMMATTMHRGALQELRFSYERLVNWMAEHKHPICGPVYEIFMNDPRELPPDQIYAGLMIPTRRS